MERERLPEQTAIKGNLKTAIRMVTGNTHGKTATGMKANGKKENKMGKVHSITG